MGYLTNFIVYMLAMVGVLVVAMLIFKHTTQSAGGKSSGKCMKVIDTLSLGARKTLYIVAAGEEKFLIAGDVDKTTLISKLNPQSTEEKISAVMTAESENFSTQSFKESIGTQLRQQNYMDKKNLGIKTAKTSPYGPVMKNLAERIKG